MHRVGMRGQSKESMKWLGQHRVFAGNPPYPVPWGSPFGPLDSKQKPRTIEKSRRWKEWKEPFATSEHWARDEWRVL